MTIAAILAGPATGVPTLLPAGGALPADGFAGLLAAALPGASVERLPVMVGAADLLVSPVPVAANGSAALALPLLGAAPPALAEMPAPLEIVGAPQPTPLAPSPVPDAMTSAGDGSVVAPQVAKPVAVVRAPLVVARAPAASLAIKLDNDDPVPKRRAGADARVETVDIEDDIGEAGSRPPIDAVAMPLVVVPRPAPAGGTDGAGRSPPAADFVPSAAQPVAEAPAITPRRTLDLQSPIAPARSGTTRKAAPDGAIAIATPPLLLTPSRRGRPLPVAPVLVADAAASAMVALPVLPGPTSPAPLALPTDAVDDGLPTLRAVPDAVPAPAIAASADAPAPLAAVAAPVIDGDSADSPPLPPVPGPVASAVERVEAPALVSASALDLPADAPATPQRGADAAPVPSPAPTEAAAASAVATAPADTAEPRSDTRTLARSRPAQAFSDAQAAPVVVDVRPAPLPAAPAPAPGVAPAPATVAIQQPPGAAPLPGQPAVAMTVSSEQFGAVSIGVDDDGGDLRVRLSGSVAAADTMAAQAPRLVAELAANGVRLGTLDISSRADAVAATASAGEAGSDQRTPGGDSSPGSGFGGADARGQRFAEGRARATAGMAALARDAIAADPVRPARFSPSERYA